MVRIKEKDRNKDVMENLLAQKEDKSMQPRESDGCRSTLDACEKSSATSPPLSKQARLISP